MRQKCWKQMGGEMYQAYDSQNETNKQQQQQQKPKRE